MSSGQLSFHRHFSYLFNHLLKSCNVTKCPNIWRSTNWNNIWRASLFPPKLSNKDINIWGNQKRPALNRSVCVIISFPSLLIISQSWFFWQKVVIFFSIFQIQCISLPQTLTQSSCVKFWGFTSGEGSMAAWKFFIENILKMIFWGEI